MIIDFKIKNYRSFKEEVVFSMEAGSSEQKMENVAELALPNNQQLGVLKIAMLFGANASGKSNIIRALFQIAYLITNKPKVDQALKLYDPFLFDVKSKESPIEFELTFIDQNNNKFEYKFKIDSTTVLSEELNYFPNGKTKTLFTRAPFDKDKTVQHGTLGDSLGKKKVEVFANQLILSKFSDDYPHELLTPVYKYFTKWTVINALNHKHKENLRKETDNKLANNSSLKARLGKLIKAADTKVLDISLQKTGDLGLNSETNKSEFILEGVHDLFENNIRISDTTLNFFNESSGTQTLYLLGGELLEVLDNGGILIVDELDNSLHPFITRLIIMLFQSEKINKKNAQLIFTAHDVTLLDKDLVRRDQIWITEKDNYGVSDLYVLRDFEDLREDTPFAKWYLAGRFGGLPNIQSIETIFEDNEKS